MQTYTNSVNGQPVATADHQEILNPATGGPIGLAPISTESDVNFAVSAARKAQLDWARVSDQERRDTVARVAQVLEENSEYLAGLITREQGKPLSGPGSRFEVQACVGWTQVPAALELPPETVYEDDERKDVLHRVPLGVVAAIAPWN